ncbi:MAG: hypothetical protein ACJAUP_002218 [Cellvibrionaceae bacterium]|jgi:uncharacterized protein (DUF58 family)
MLSWSWKKIINGWLKRRIPRQVSHRLQHRNIFILPSKTGLGFLLLIFLLWLLGTNYQNNLVLATAFLLLALIIVCIHHTYAYLAGLQITVVKTHPGFMGQTGTVDLVIKRLNTRYYESVELDWSHGKPVLLSLIDKDKIEVSLVIPLKHRGWFQPERLKISTDFPLGLIVAWSYLDFEAPILAYPEPVPSAVQPVQQLLDDTNDLEHQLLASGHEEFAGLREYQDGDSLRNVDWRAMAKGQGLASRIYEDYVSQRYWLDWQQFEGMSREARLSRLCACVLEQEASAKNNAGLIYGLRLPGQIIEANYGEQHKNTLLEALALFEFDQADFGAKR